MGNISWGNIKRWAGGLIRAANYHTHGRLFTPAPTYVCFRVTKNCNAECIMCSDWKNRARGEITVEEVRQIFSNPLLKDLKWVNVLGGEPTIRRDLPDIIQTIYEHTNSGGVGLNTNGFVSDKVVGRVAETLEKSKANPRTRNRRLLVMISVDGVAELHDQIRGFPHGFEKICKTLEQLQILQKSDPRLSLSFSCCVQPQNLHGTPELQKFALERGVSINFFPLRFAHVFGNLHDRTNLLFQFSESQTSAFETFIHETARYQSEPAFRWVWDEHFAVDRGAERQLPCLWFYGGFMLFPDGNVTLCDSDPEQVVGNIREQSIDAILGSSHVIKARDALKKSRCPTCSFTTSDPAMNLNQEFWYKVKRRLRGDAVGADPRMIDNDTMRSDS